MKGVIINCPYKECRKMLMKNTYLRPGSALTMLCYYCGMPVTIKSGQGTIELIKEKEDKVIDKSVEKSDFDDDDNGDIMFISI